MAPHFCDNLACPLHREIPDQSFRQITYRADNGREVSSLRWPIVRAEDNKQFFFCTCCANVAAMLHTLTNKT